MKTWRNSHIHRNSNIFIQNAPNLWDRIVWIDIFSCFSARKMSDREKERNWKKWSLCQFIHFCLTLMMPVGWIKVFLFQSKPMIIIQTEIDLISLKSINFITKCCHLLNREFSSNVVQSCSKIHSSKIQFCIRVHWIAKCNPLCVSREWESHKLFDVVKHS